jgi:hypothetical protein
MQPVGGRLLAIQGGLDCLDISMARSLPLYRQFGVKP